MTNWGAFLIGAGIIIAGISVCTGLVYIADTVERIVNKKFNLKDDE